MQKYPIQVFNKLHSAQIVRKQFKHENGNIIDYSVLELGLLINGEIRPISFTLSQKSNQELLIMASKTKKQDFLGDDEIM